MLHELQERIATKLAEAGKVINREATEVAAPTTLPPPTRYRRQPKSNPERLAYAREYKRARKAGNPNAAAAARAAAQAAKTTDEPTSTPAAISTAEPVSGGLRATTVPPVR